MKKIINKISKAVQVILLAPIKLPGKALHIVKYIALGIGILDSLIEHDRRADEPMDNEKGEPDENPERPTQ